MTQKSETRLQISRIIQAEREKVFEAWTRPELMKKWFCPEELKVAEVKADAREGGQYLIAMKDEARDKTFTTFGTYKEIIPNQKLVFTWEWEEPDQAESLVTVTFKDKNGGTEVTVLHERFVDMAEEKSHEEGWTSALENLAKQIETRDREIVLSRVFDAPRERVFEAMTDPKQVVKWWGPNGFTTTIHEMDLRPGGIWRHTMHGPDGTDYPNRSVFIEIVKPERVVYTNAGGKKDLEVTFTATWTFEAVDSNKTKLTMRLVFPSAEMCENVAKKYGAVEGGKQTLGRLAEHLKKQK